VIDEEQVPGGVDEPIAEVRVFVVDEAIEHLGADNLFVPTGRVDRRGSRRSSQFLEALDRLHPHDGGAERALDALLDGGRNHLQLEELVDLVGRDLRSIALPETIVAAGLNP
jgi:hypothetical protein